MTEPNQLMSDRLIDEISQEFPGFRLVPKRGNTFSLLIDRALKIVTLGRQRHYITRYHTVIGSTLYTPIGWDSTPDLDRLITLRHERVHLRQRRRLTFPLMAFLYLIPFFPIGFAFGRARLEWEAYEETLRATAEFKGLRALRSDALRDEIVERFTGPDYGWMWPFRGAVLGWYERAVAEIERSVGGQPT